MVHKIFVYIQQKEEQKENEELLAGQAITKKSKQKGARQTKITSMVTSQKASTLPSAYGEVIQPIVPEFHEKVIKKPRAVKRKLLIMKHFCMIVSIY